MTLPNRVNVRVFATLRRYVEDAEAVDVGIDRRETVADVLDRLGIPTDQVRIIFIDGRKSSLQHELSGGETLSIFPAIGGG